MTASIIGACSESLAKSSAYSRKPDVTSTYRLLAPVHLPDVPSAYDGSLPSVPEVSAPSRRTDAARSLVGILLYLVSVGFVGAAIIGICFGIGFFLLASPASDFDRNPPRVYGDAPDSGREAVLVARETGMPHSAALAALPGSSPAEPPAMGGSAQVSPPVPPSTEPPTQIAPVPGPAPSQSVSLAPPTQGPTAFATESAGLFSDKAGHASQSGRPAIRQSSARWAAGHGQSVHRHSKLNATERAAFDQLITQLSGETKSVDQQLTPPQSGQPDPFAQRVRNK